MQATIEAILPYVKFCKAQAELTLEFLIGVSQPAYCASRMSEFNARKRGTESGMAEGHVLNPTVG
jgi:hypothetical protein